MPDFFADSIQDQRVTFNKEDSHHALKVLRLREGEALRVSVDGKRYEAVFEGGKELATAKITGELESSEPGTRVTLYQGWPKGDKVEQIIRQCTEMGVYAVVPVVFSRCVAKPDNEKRLERLQKIAREAAMQSGRTIIPSVLSPIAVEELYTRLSQHELALVPYEKERQSALRETVKGQRDIALVIGPEGGITENEIANMPAMPITLGRRILRTETAGLASIAMILALNNDN